MSKYLTTSELEEYINQLYAKVEPLAKRDGVHRPLRNYFDQGRPFHWPPYYCYADDDGYHYLSRDIRDPEYTEFFTQSLAGIAFKLLYMDVWEMAIRYRDRHEVEGQDSNRIFYAKMLEYCGAMGAEFAELERRKMEEELREHPFED